MDSFLLGLILFFALCVWYFIASVKAEKRKIEEKQYYEMQSRLDKLSINVKTAKRSDTAQRRIKAMQQEIDSIRSSVPREWTSECDRALQSARSHQHSLEKAEADHRAAEARIKEHQRQQKEKEKQQKKAERQKNMTPEQIAHRDFMAEQRRLMTDSLRYDIMRRDGFRCQLCGATAQDGVKLHVDHVVPVSKGGKTEPSNLRTLCERCNLGKSNKTE